MKIIEPSSQGLKKFVFIGVLLYSFLMCTLFIYAHAQAAPKKIECGVISGKVMFIDKSASEWSERQGTFEVKTGGRVKAGDSGSAVLNYSDGTMVALRPGAEIEVKADGIRLNDGGVWVKLIKTKSGFKVDTPSVTIGARGTIFSVIKNQEKVLVKLVEGVIDIINRQSGKTLAMKAGDAVIVKAKEIIEVNNIDKNKINAVLKQNSFSEIDFDLNAVPEIFKFNLNTDSKNKQLDTVSENKADTIAHSSAEVNIINGSGSDSIEFENNTDKIAPQDAQNLKDLLGR